MTDEKTRRVILELEQVRRSFALQPSLSAKEITDLMRRILHAGGEVVERSGVDPSEAIALHKEHAKETAAMVRAAYPSWRQPPLGFRDIVP
jgi:hypothetical protein